MEELLLLLGSIRPLSDVLATHLRQVMRPKTLKKGDTLQQPGEPSACMYFIQSGLLRAYRLEDGRQICTWFQNEGNVVMSIKSWYARAPTDEYIEALEDCIVFYLTREELDHIYAAFPEFNLNGRILTENYYLMVWNWFDLVRTKKAHERYAFFIDNFGDWVKRVPSKDIASFLGVSKAALQLLQKEKALICFEIETVFWGYGLQFDAGLYSPHPAV